MIGESSNYEPRSTPSVFPIFPALLKVGISSKLVTPHINYEDKRSMGWTFGLRRYRASNSLYCFRHVLRHGRLVVQHRSSRCFATAVCLPTLAHYIQKFIKILPRALSFLLPPSSFLLSLPPRPWFSLLA